ncbi:MAG: PEP/pyruvate-binding domain-containing protein [Pseudomonadota bacterium]
MKLICLIIVAFLFLGFHPAIASETGQFQSWIEKMKKEPRGPFARIRWFCNDGTVQAPTAYGCREHGGGVQHGEWTDQISIMRDQGHYIANVFADVVPDVFIKNPLHSDILKQMILEQFLMKADDGWIFRRARYYRGALQSEDEARGGERLLKGLLNARHTSQEQFLLLREAVRLLPHYQKNAPTSEMRQVSLALAAADKNFESLRIKIHVRPESGDADRVRAYARKRSQTELGNSYEHLAKIIDAVFRPEDMALRLLELSRQIRNQELIGQLKQGADRLAKTTDPFIRFEIAGDLIVLLRRHLSRAGDPAAMLAVLDVGILLEDEAFRLGTDLLERLPKASLGQSLDWLSQSTDILYGTGLISGRQHNALKKRFERQLKTRQDLHQFRDDLSYAARASDWAEQNLEFHFSRTIDHFQRIEPISRRYVHDRLHTSLLLVYSSVLERLMTDNSRQLGIANDIWGRSLSFGINGLNPGLARGVLKEPKPGDDLQKFSLDSILLLPATTSDLPPVAGIITAGKGNILSHVQLLARNLGIPNVAVDNNLLPEIKSRENRQVVLAVSPKGIVQMTDDHPGWDDIFARKVSGKRSILKADVGKLDLTQAGFITLREIRAKDSGRIAGPKAANLGELKHHFPDLVTEGVVIPFGLFRKMLDQPIEPSGSSMFDWMKDQYMVIHALRENPSEQKFVIDATLSRIRTWILKIDPGEKFRQDLRDALEKTLGPDGSYGVFVRSDTNVEDLPGFTGAGLNLTVPHVKGFDNILAAIRRVWASPFTQRSFGWRHAFLENPEHVYASVLLMKTVPVEKSGVMVTKDIDTGQSGWLTLAINEGVGGAVSGQTAEELKIDTRTGEVTLLSQATEPLKMVVLEQGGMVKADASGRDALLGSGEIARLVEFAKQLPDRFPKLRDDQGRPVPADVEFGFYKDKLVLFQIRPFLDDFHTQHDLFLSKLDRQFEGKKEMMVDLDRIPEQESP